VAVAARGACGELRGEARRQEELEPEGERLGAGRRGRVRVEQVELAAEQVVGGPVRLLRVEQPQDGVARLRGALERLAALAQARVGGNRLGRGDRAPVAPSLVQE